MKCCVSFHKTLAPSTFLPSPSSSSSFLFYNSGLFAHLFCFDVQEAVVILINKAVTKFNLTYDCDHRAIPSLNNKRCFDVSTLNIFFFYFVKSSYHIFLERDFATRSNCTAFVSVEGGIQSYNSEYCNHLIIGCVIIEVLKRNF